MVLKSVTKKKTNETANWELLSSFQENDHVEEQGLKEAANNVNNSQETILIIRRYKDTIKTENKKEIGYIGKQGQLLKKLKDTEHFLGNFGQSRSKIYFKVSLINYWENILCLKNEPHNPGV